MTKVPEEIRPQLKVGQRPVIGDTLYSLNVGNSARGCPSVLTELKVIKSGNKYFTCRELNGHGDFTYEIEDWRQKTDYTPNSKLYATKEDWIYETKINAMYRDIRDFLSLHVNKLPGEVIENMHACIPKSKGNESQPA